MLETQFHHAPVAWGGLRFKHQLSLWVFATTFSLLPCNGWPRTFSSSQISSRKADRIGAMPWREEVGNNRKSLADSNKKIYVRRATVCMLRKIFYVVRKKNHVVRKKFYVASIFGGAASRKNRPPWEVSSTAGEVSSTEGSFFPTASRGGLQRRRVKRNSRPPSLRLRTEMSPW